MLGLVNYNILLMLLSCSVYPWGNPHWFLPLFYESNHVPSTTFFLAKEEFLKVLTSFTSPNDNPDLSYPMDYQGHHTPSIKESINYNSLGSPSHPRPRLVLNYEDMTINHPPIQDIVNQFMAPIPTTNVLQH